MDMTDLKVRIRSGMQEKAHHHCCHVVLTFRAAAFWVSFLCDAKEKIIICSFLCNWWMHWCIVEKSSSLFVLPANVHFVDSSLWRVKYFMKSNEIFYKKSQSRHMWRNTQEDVEILKDMSSLTSMKILWYLKQYILSIVEARKCRGG